MTAKEVRYETYLVEDAELILVSYGTASRIAKGAVNRMRREGYKVGLFRPITLWPYPKVALRALAKEGVKIGVFELCVGQMVEDVIMSVGGRSEVHLLGIPGGPIPTPADVQEFALSVLRGDGKVGKKVEI
jgi:2-oxoglutarate ferredoxin oxidoreductase subunit alpha